MNSYSSRILPFVLLFIAVIFWSPIQAQNNAQHEKLSKKFKNYEIAEIPSVDLYNQLDIHTRNQSLEIDLGQGMKWDLVLDVNPIFSEKYTLQYGETTLGHPIKNNRVKPMVGHLKNLPDSKVAIAFNHHFIFGEINVGMNSYFIEPLSYHIEDADPDQFIYYSIKDIILDEEYQCGYEKYKTQMDQFKGKEPEVHERMPGGCYIVEYAIAADWSMVVKFGSAIDVENHITGVVNNVQNNYDNEFDDEIQFEIVTFWVSSCSTCDPWPSTTDPYTVLPAFSSWANGGAFGVTHDVGSMWSNRVYQDNIVGLAWVGVICTGNKYNILRDFTSNANFLRVMTAHELGHNFSAGHDGSGSNTIMAPSVNSATQWSATSRSAIQNHYLSRWCLSNCSTLPPPNADFDFNVISECVVGQVQYTDQSTGATSWSWSFPGGTPSTSTQQNPLISYQNPGTYGATLTATNTSGSDSHTINNVVTIGEGPNASFTFVVNGATVTFTNTSTNATSYSWDFGDGNLSNQTNPVHTYEHDGFYNVILTAFNDCGPEDFSVVIEIATPPIAEFSANPVSGCSPLLVNFTDESTTNTIQWIWTFEGGNPSQSFVQNPSVIYNLPGTYSVTLTAANAQGSSTFVRQQYITVQQNPTSSFSYVKNGLTVTFTNTSTNATDFLWTFGDGNTSNQQHPVHTYANAGTYTVILQSSNDCGTVTSTQTITFSLAPEADFTTSNSPQGCLPYTVQFLNTSQNNPTTYLWNFEGGSPSTSTQQHPSVVYQNAGTFDVTLIATNAQGSDTLTLHDYITIGTVPSVGFTYINTDLIYSFTAVTQNANSVHWDFGDGSESTEFNPVHTYAGEGTYTVTLTATNECGDVMSIQDIVIVLAPIAQFSANITSGCIPLTVQFTDESSSNTTQWMWSFPGGIPATSTEQNPLVVYNNPGNYTVSLIASNSAGQNSISQTNYISTRTIPSSGFTIEVDGPHVTLTNTGSNATQTDWQIQENGIQALQGHTVVHTFDSNGTFSIIQINSNDCGSVTLEQFVTINAYPSANFTISLDNNCAPSTIQLSNNSINATDFNWSFENGVPATSSDPNPTVTYNDPGTYVISLVAENQYGTNTFSQSVTILGAPNPEFSFVKNALIVSFNNTTAGTGNAYLWDFGDGEFSNDANPVHTYPSPGTYLAVLSVTNECGTTTITKEVIIDDRSPVVGFESDIQVGCVPLTVHFKDLSTNDPTEWEWNFEGGTPTTSNEKDPVIVYNQEGIYDVQLIASNGFGSSEYSEQNYITVYGPPTAAFTFNVMESEITTTYTGSLVSSYSWDFGDGTRSSQKSPSHKYTSSGNYTIVLVVENPCGSDTISINVQITLSSTSNPNFEGIVRIAPNPNQGFFKIIFENLAGQIIHAEMINLQGHLVGGWEHMVVNSMEIIESDLSYLPAGMYILKLINSKGAVQVKKVQITK